MVAVMIGDMVMVVVTIVVVMIGEVVIMVMVQLSQ